MSATDTDESHDADRDEPGPEAFEPPPYSTSVPMSTGEILDRGPLTLGVRERTTYQELARLNPELAGLFTAGHELARRADESGIRYLLAHVGRELSRGVVHCLADEDFHLEGADDETENTERNRDTIGVILHLPPNHASVTAWFHLNKIFSENAHFRSASRPVQQILGAFLQFSELLYGRVAPYFATHAELDQLLALSTPSTSDIKRARALLARPQQRHYFFGYLQHPAWLEPLGASNHFDSPPERLMGLEARSRMQPWPEGEYLARMAAQEHARVTALLLKIPDSLQNSVVWGVVVNAAKILPATSTKQLVPLIVKALKAVPPGLFTYHTIELVRILAQKGEACAFRLSEALVWLADAPKAEVAHETSSEYLAMRHDTNWMLKRIEVNQLKEFCKNAIPALSTQDELKTIKLLAKSLDRAVFLMTTVASDEGHQTHDESRLWCDNLEHGESDDDVRAIFATALTRVVERTAAQGPEGARAVWSALGSYKSDIFRRIRYAILAKAGTSLQTELDGVIGSDVLLEQPFLGREAAALLRTQYGNASDGARLLFLHALERGASANDIRKSVENRRAYLFQGAEESNIASEWLPTAQEIIDQVSYWQQRVLRCFHDLLPSEFRDLGNRLSFVPVVPSAKQQGLDEVGHYSGEAFWVVEQSPESAEELAGMESLELCDFLSTWHPDLDRNPLDAPSHNGLEQALLSFATEHPAFAICVARQGLDYSIAPIYLSGILSGLRATVEANKEIPWAETIPAALAAVRAAEGESTRQGASAGTASQAVPAHANAALAPPTSTSSTSNVNPDMWQPVLRAVMELVRTGCAKKVVPRELSDAVWEIADVLVRSPNTWRNELGTREPSSFGEVLSAALNTLGGNVTHLLLEVALWDYRHHVSEQVPQPDTEPLISQIESRLSPLLEHILSQYGSNNARGAHSMLGHFVPQLYVLAPSWTTATEERLFGDGVEDPIRHPIWGSYILRSHFHDKTFRQLRPWYARAALAHSDATDNSKKATDNEWSLARGLASHVLFAVTRGLASIGDEDALVETTYLNVSAKDRSRSYWRIFHDRNEAPFAVPEGSHEGW